MWPPRVPIVFIVAPQLMNTPHCLPTLSFLHDGCQLVFSRRSVLDHFSGLGRDIDHFDGSADRAEAVRSSARSMTKDIR
jgi:hypothetical protein